MAQSKTQVMKKALGEMMTPFLMELDFTGEYPDYIRKHERWTDAVSFVLNRSGNLSIEIAQVLPDGSVPGQPGKMETIKASWAHYSIKHRIGSVPWGHEGFLNTGWLDTQRMSPEVFPQLGQQAVSMIQQEAVPWFEAVPVMQYLDIVQSAVPYLQELGFMGSFPDFRRMLPERVDLLGFFLDKRGCFEIEIAQVRSDGSEGFGKPPYPYAKPEHMRFYNVSSHLRKRLKKRSGTIWGKRLSSSEEAVEMIHREAEPWFRRCPALR